MLEQEPPDLEALECRVAAVLESEGDALRQATCCYGPACANRPSATASPASAAPRATAIIERHQWLAAVTAFANPVLALGPMAVGAVQLRMLSEMAAVYDVQLSSDFVEKVGNQMAQTLLKLGVAEVTASVLAGFFKFNPLGFAAGGIVQAVTMGYLTRLTGATFVEFLERGQTWGEGGMQKELSRSSRRHNVRSGSCSSPSWRSGDCSGADGRPRIELRLWHRYCLNVSVENIQRASPATARDISTRGGRWHIWKSPSNMVKHPRSRGPDSSRQSARQRLDSRAG